MRVGELQAKDVINVVDGRKLGVIGDLEIDLETGMVKTLIIPPEGKFFGLFTSGDEVIIPWNQIIKIGSDVVLVDLRSGSDTAFLPSASSSGSISGN